MSTETPATSRDLLPRLEHVYLSARAVVDALPAERFDERLPSGMTLRELVAHLAAWEETVAPRVEHVLAHGTDPGEFEDIDGFNARVFADARGATADELRARLVRSHAKVLEVVRSLEGRDAPKLALDIVEWNTTGHYPDHFGDLGAAIRTAAELAAAIAQGWMTFRLALVAIGRAGIDRPTPAGWTYKALAAHAAGWERLTAQRLARFRATGDRSDPGGTVDEINARLVAEADARAAREVLDSLEAAHAALLAEVARLTPEQLHAHGGWVLAIVAGNTYGHYAEHNAELMAAVPRTPAELAERVRDGWRSLHRTVAQAGLEPLARATESGWSGKAMLAHLAYWMETAPAELGRRLAGERPVVPNIDAENAKTAADAARSSAREVVVRLERAYAGALAAVNALPADRELPFAAVRFVAAETYGHFWKHERELEPFVPRSRAALLQRLGETWARFREGVRGVGRARLTERTSAGWRYVDMLAHIAAWMQQAVRELESGDFRRWGDGEIQAFNDRAVESHRLVGPEAMLDELDTSYQNLRDAIAALSDERMRDRRVEIVTTYYTYLAWEEHFAELGVTV